MMFSRRNENIFPALFFRLHLSVYACYFTIVRVTFQIYLKMKDLSAIFHFFKTKILLADLND